MANSFLAVAGRTFVLAIVSLNQVAHAGDFVVTQTASSTVDPAALTIDGIYGQSINGLSFQQDALTSFKGYQYVGYYDAQRHLCLGRRALGSTAWDVIRFGYEFKGDDAHNTVSVGICEADGTIHLAFDHHGGPLHYCVSKPGVASDPAKIVWDAGSFGSVTNGLDKPIDSVTYPRFIRTPDGGLQLAFRSGTSGKGDDNLSTYDPKSGSWRDTHMTDTGNGDWKDSFGPSPARCAYPNGYTYDRNGRLHVTWAWRENTQGANHDLAYTFSDDRGMTWKNNAGGVVGTTDGKQIINIDSPGIVVWPITRKQSLMNQQTQAVDSAGRIHAVMWHTTDESTYKTDHPWNVEASHYFHYWRDADGKWHQNQIPSPVGNRPKLFFDKNDNAYCVFTVKRETDAWWHDIYYTAGDLVIAAATAKAEWKDWKIIHNEAGPFMNEVLGDTFRFADDGVLSLLLQDTPAHPGAAAALKVLDFRIQSP